MKSRSLMGGAWRLPALTAWLLLVLAAAFLPSQPAEAQTTPSITLSATTSDLHEVDDPGTAGAKENQFTVGIALGSEPTANVTYTPKMVDGDGNTLVGVVTFNPTFLTFTPANWATSQSFTVTAVPVAGDNLSRSGTLSADVTGGNYDGRTPTTFTTNVLDSEPTVVSLRAGADTTATEGDSGDTAQAVVSVGRPLASNEKVTVTVGFVSGSDDLTPGADINVSTSSPPSWLAASASGDDYVLVFTGPTGTDVAEAVIEVGGPDDADGDGLAFDVVADSAVTTGSLTGAGYFDGGFGGLDADAKRAEFLYVIDDEAAAASVTAVLAVTDDEAAEDQPSDPGEFTITLGRALTAGERLEAVLGFAGGVLGEDDDGGDFTLEAQSASGVSLDPDRGSVIFTGPSAQAAAVRVLAGWDRDDTTDETVTVSIAGVNQSGFAPAATASGSGTVKLVDQTTTVGPYLDSGSTTPTEGDSLGMVVASNYRYSRYPPLRVRVHWRIDLGTAHTADMSAASGSVVWAGAPRPGECRLGADCPIEVTVTDDMHTESDETLAIEIHRLEALDDFTRRNMVVDLTDGTRRRDVTILDDDTSMGVTATLTAVGEAELTEGDAGGAATLRVTLSRPLRAAESLPLFVRYDGVTLKSGSGAAGDAGRDITHALRGAVTAPSAFYAHLEPDGLYGSHLVVQGPAGGRTVFDIVLTAAQNDRGNAERFTATLSLSEYSSYGIGGGVTISGSVTVVYEDDERNGVQSESRRVTVLEGAEGGSPVKIRLTAQPVGGDTTVTLSPSEGLTVVPAALTFTASDWSQYKFVRVSARDNDRRGANPDGSVAYSFSGGGYAGTVAPALPVVVADDDGGVGLHVAPTTVSEGGSVLVVVSATRSSNLGRQDCQSIGVGVGAAGDTAGSDDYSHSGVRVLCFGEGEASASEAFSIEIDDDALDEARERFTVFAEPTVHIVSDVSLSARVSETVTVIDDDPTEVRLTLEGPQLVAEGEPGGPTKLVVGIGAPLSRGRLVVPVEVSPAAGVTHYSPSDLVLALEAAPGVSFDPRSRTLTFAGGPDTPDGATLVAAAGEDADPVDETVLVGLGPIRHSGLDGGLAPPAADAVPHRLTLFDNDGGLTVPPEAIVDEGIPAGCAYDVALDRAPAADAVVRVSSRNPAVAAPTTATASLTFTPLNWATPQCVALTAPENTTRGNGLAIFDHRVSGAGFTTVGDAFPVAVHVLDNDGRGIAQFAEARVTAGESDGRVYVTVNFSPWLSTAATVGYTVGGGGTATAGVDYKALPGTVQTAGNYAVRGVNIGVDILDNERNDGNRTIILTLRPNTAYDIGTVNRVVITIVDDEGPPPPTASFASATASVSEVSGRRSTDLRVNISPAPTAAFTLRYGVAGTATAGADYTALSGSVSVARGQSSATIRVTALDDIDDDDNEEVVVTLNPATGYTVGSPATATVTIADDDGTPSASFASAATTAAEGNRTVNLRVNLLPAPQADITLNYSVTGTATAGDDYTAPSGTVSVSRGRSSVNIPLRILHDIIDETDETVIVTLNAGTGYALASADTQARVTITDDDGTPEARFHETEVTAAEGNRTVNLRVNLSPAPQENIVLNYSVIGTATADEDYTALSGTVSVSRGRSSVNIPLRILHDINEEGTETVILTLSAGTGYALATADTTMTVHITDDDVDAVVEFDSTTATVTEASGGRSIDLRVNLSPAPRQNIVLNYSVGGTADAGTDYRALPGMLRVSRGQTSATIRFTALDDTADDNDEVVTLTLTDGDGYRLGDDLHVTVIITDDDAPPPVAAFRGSAARFTEAGGPDDRGVIRMTLTPGAGQTEVTETVDVNFTVAGTALEGHDYGELGRTYTFPRGKDAWGIAFRTIDDYFDEPDETVVLTIVPGEGYEVGTPNTFTVTIADNPAGHPPKAPEANFVARGNTVGGHPIFNAKLTEAPGRRTVTLVVQLSQSRSVDTHVHFTVRGDATRGSDYILSRNNNIRIIAGNTRGTLSIAVQDDNLPEGNNTADGRVEWIELYLDDANPLDPADGYRTGRHNWFSVMIVDDD